MTTWSGTYELTFGNSNYRFFNAILSYLQRDKKEIDSLYRYALENYKIYIAIREAVWRFKQVYEVTGKGSVSALDLNQNLKTVNYIIYNNPSSDFITVKSSSQILQSLLKSKDIPQNPFTTTVTISKEEMGEELQAINTYLKQKLKI